MRKNRSQNKTVLVGVLKSRRDLEILLTERWYRIPKKYMPRRKFKYLAFYQPEIFGRQGKRIQYYARVLGRRVMYRREMLPDEAMHPRAQALYVWLQVGPVKELPVAIKNTTPRRVSFGFTTFPRLLNSKNILELYGIVATEDIVSNALQKAGIQVQPQKYVTDGKKRYYLDFAVMCRNGKVAIECDNAKAHAGPRQRLKDEAKDEFLRRQGWLVIRLTEQDVISNLPVCVARVTRAVKRRGGQEHNEMRLTGAVYCRP